jgi:hypothetical protein
MVGLAQGAGTPARPPQSPSTSGRSPQAHCWVAPAPTCGSARMLAASAGVSWGLATEIADGHALRKQGHVDFDRSAERRLRRIDGRRRAGDSAQRLNRPDRPLAAGDEAAIASWFAGLSAGTRYARFFGFLEQLDRRTESARARVDHFNHERGSRRQRNYGRNRALPPHRQARGGEVAVAVADDWRGQASLACCSNRSQPVRVPSRSSHTP